MIRGGPHIGSMIRMISNVSRKNPRMNITAMTASMAPNGPPGTFLSASSTKCSPPRPRKTSENIDAASTITKMIEVVTIVLRAA